MEDFVVVRNPDADSTLPYLLRLPLSDAGIVLKVRDTWPRTAKVYCHPSTDWPDDPEIVERVPRQARPKVSVPTQRASGQVLEILVDSHERSAWKFTAQQATTRRQARPAGDHAVELDGAIVAAVERKSRADVVSTTTTGKLRYLLAALAELPRAALVVEDRYSAVFKVTRPHPVLLVSVAALAISWIEAPYDWAMYAQFPPAIPRMPSWWPLDMTWGGLPAPVPLGYISYFVLPAVIGAAIGRRAAARFGWRRPQTLLAVGFAVGFVWAFCFNALLGARLGVFHYGRVIPGLALWEGTTHQYPIYDSVAMALQMMVFAYLLGRTDAGGRNLIEAWADSRTSTPRRSFAVSVRAAVVVGHALYLAVFAPHLVTKLRGDVTAGPTEQLFAGVENQPLHGGG